MKSLSRLGAIIKKEVVQLSRDRLTFGLTFGMVFGLPVMQILLFGFAINTDVRYLRTAVANQAETHLSRQFVAELSASQVVNIIATAQTPEELEALLRRGEVSLGVLIPADFDRRVADKNRAAVHLCRQSIAQSAHSIRLSTCPGAKTIIDRSSRPLQPRAAFARQYCSRTNGRHPDDDHDVIHRRRYRSRT